MKKLLSITGKKLRVLMNGRLWITVLCLLVLGFLFVMVGKIVTAKRSDRVSITVVDECGSELSGRLVEKLKAIPGFELSFSDEKLSAEDDIMRGSSEAVLIIMEDYDSKLDGVTVSGCIKLIMAPSSVSSGYIREAVSGCVLSERARVTVLEELEDGGYPTDDFDRYCESFDAPTLYKVTTLNGASSDRAVFGKTFPGYTGFVSLALILIMLTLSKQLGVTESELVANRLYVLPKGRVLASLSDILALFMISIVFSGAAFAFAPDRSVSLAVALAAYSVNLSGLCLLVAGISGGGRIDAVSPVFALITAILGGCFADVASFVPVFAFVSKLTPEGQFIAAAGGNHLFSVIMAAEGVLLMLVSQAIRSRSRR